MLLWFCFSSHHDWSRKLISPSLNQSSIEHQQKCEIIFYSSGAVIDDLLSPSLPITCKTKTDRHLITHVFPRFRHFPLVLLSQQSTLLVNVLLIHFLFFILTSILKCQVQFISIKLFLIKLVFFI